MLLPYTEAFGVAKATRAIVDFLEGQEEVIKNIRERYEEENAL